MMVASLLLAAQVAAAAPPSTPLKFAATLGDEMVLQSSPAEAIVWGPLGSSASTVSVSWQQQVAGGASGSPEEKQLPLPPPPPVEATIQEWLGLKIWTATLPPVQASFDRYTITATPNQGASFDRQRYLRRGLAVQRPEQHGLHDRPRHPLLQQDPERRWHPQLLEGGLRHLRRSRVRVERGAGGGRHGELPAHPADGRDVAAQLRSQAVLRAGSSGSEQWLAPARPVCVAMPAQLQRLPPRPVGGLPLRLRQLHGCTRLLQPRR